MKRVLYLILLFPFLFMLHDAGAVEKRPARSEVSSHKTVFDLPLAQRYALSETIGRDQSNYHSFRDNGVLHAVNDAQSYSVRFNNHGAEVQYGDNRFSLTLLDYGYEDVRRAALPAEPTARANRVSYHRGSVTEWYVNGPLGLQQGFTIHRPPVTNGKGQLSLSLGLNGSFFAVSHDNELGMDLSTEDGLTSLCYNGLTVYDATGKTLPARLRTAGNRITITVDDRESFYPLVIDPVLQSVKLTANDPNGSNYQFGFSVAIDGDTIVVGSQNIGFVYVFEKPATGWTDMLQTAKLTGDDGTAFDWFGTSVAISGGTVVVGAPGHNSGKGMVYVFEKPASGWSDMTQAAKLINEDGTAYDELGLSVAISGDTVVAGAPDHNSDQGAVYVFEKPSTGWTDMTQTAKLTSDDGAANDGFGEAVAISSDAIVVGAPNQNEELGAAYVFSKPGPTWGDMTQTAKLTSSVGGEEIEFGGSVAISGDVIVVGCPRHEAAYVFEQQEATWTDMTETAKLTNDDLASSDLGESVAINGNTIIVGSPGNNSFQGATYIFEKPGATWSNMTQTAKLTTDEGAVQDYFGGSVFISGDTVITGAFSHDTNGTLNQGAAYIFNKPGESWGNMDHQTARISCTESYSILDEFGTSVAISGGTVVVGVPRHDTGGNVDQGAAYVFEQPVSGWTNMTQIAKLISDDGANYDYFGSSVAIDGDTVVIGARSHDEGGNSDQGAVYVFEKPISGWTDMSHSAKLTSDDGTADDWFGTSVAVSLTTIIVGANLHNSHQGAAYVFEKAGVAWSNMTQTAKLTSTYSTPESFGNSVAMDGNSIAVGAYSHDAGGNANQGAVYLFYKPLAGWIDMTQTAKLISLNGAANEWLGQSVAISGDTVAAGANGYNMYQGAVYLFEKPFSGWADMTQTAILAAKNGGGQDALGWTVAISGDLVVAGAPSHDVDGNIDQGAAYIFEKPASGWLDMTETNKILASDGRARDRFGWSAAISGESILIGSPKHDLFDRYRDSGAVYVLFSQQQQYKFPWPAFIPAIIGNKK